MLSLAIIGLVLMQRGKGAEAGAALGGGASATVFGSRGAANFLSRSTAVLATAFFISSLFLAFMASQRDEPTSVIEAGSVIEQPAPAASSDLPAADPATQAPGSDVPAAD